jgi:hypothetical protein
MLACLNSLTKHCSNFSYEILHEYDVINTIHAYEGICRKLKTYKMG